MSLNSTSEVNLHDFGVFCDLAIPSVSTYAKETLTVSIGGSMY